MEQDPLGLQLSLCMDGELSEQEMHHFFTAMLNSSQQLLAWAEAHQLQVLREEYRKYHHLKLLPKGLAKLQKIKTPSAL